MAKAAEKYTPAVTVEPYAEPAGTRHPPYFGEREPTVHIVRERIYLQPSLYTQGVMEGLRVAAARWLGGQRRRWRRDPVAVVVEDYGGRTDRRTAS